MPSSSNSMKTPVNACNRALERDDLGNTARRSRSTAHADPGCFDSSSPECGGHTWNGPLHQTWDTPGYFGGWNNGESGTELCSPFSYQCQGVAPTP